MEIQHLKLLNFRNYEQLDIDFNSKMNIIYGDNGVGKSNIVEAIYCLALTKSFRTTDDKNLIKQGEKETRISAKVKKKIEHEYELVLNDDGKKALINGNAYKRLSDYISKIQVIVFSPDDLKMIKESPSIRRKLLNVDISLLNNNYLKYLASYNKILKQRNSYLKTVAVNGNSSMDYLDILTNSLIEHGLKIYEYRKKFINELNESIESIYSNISGIEGLTIKYISSYSDETKEDLVKLYKKGLERDLFLGKTNIGIHHDDITFLLPFGDLKDYGSEGQQKNAIIAYKLAEVELFKRINESYPILILDDLFSELDKKKINNILNMLDKDMQTFITTTNVTFVKKSIRNNSKLYRIINGKIEEE